MRWVVATAGALALLAGFYLALRPRWSRPVLRVGLNARAGNAEDAAIAAGVRMALDERDERGGRFRVAVVPYPIDARGVSYSKRNFQMWMPGLDVPGERQDESGASLIDPGLDEKAERILEWAKARGLRRVALPTSPRALEIPGDAEPLLAYLGTGPNLGHVLEKKLPPSDLLRPSGSGIADGLWTADRGPDLVVLDNVPGLVVDVRAAGYAGPIFLSSFNQGDLKGLDGCLAVLSPLKPTPPEFRHPFAYAGYRGALAFLDALDAAPGAEPEELCVPWIFSELRGEPRVYEVRGGRFVPK